MKRSIYLLLVCLFACCTAAFAQTVTLGFTAKDSANQYVRLNRVVITNHTQNWQETIYWPDTVLVMQNVTGIADVETWYTTSLQLSQNIPNPFTGTTEVGLTVAKEGEVGLQIADVNGKIIETQNFASLRPGIHQFRITLSTVGIYVMTARQSGYRSSIKMVCNGGADGNKIEYTGSVETQCIASLQSSETKNSPKDTTTNPFTLGDQMEYVGYASINGTETESQHITQVQQVSETIVLLFDTVQTDALPCPGTPTVTDADGNIYNTVQIGTQCWMKENLRTSSYVNGTSIPMGDDTSITTACRYYPDNDQSNVSTYGYLYNWKAVMGGSSSSSANPSGVQGICPTGWHVPSDAEWTQLTDYVSSKSQYVCGDDNTSIARALASTTGWNGSMGTCAVGYNPSASVTTGFSALPAGFYNGNYFNFGSSTNFWSATEDYDGNAFSRFLFYSNTDVSRYNRDKNYGYSVRCVRDVYGAISVVTQSVSNLTANSVTCGGEVIADGGAPVTACGFCWSTSENPTLNDNHTVDNSESAVFTSIITDLSAATTYYVRAYATNSEGTTYGNELIFTTLHAGDALPCPGAATVTDIDSNTYNTVQIGNQCWMKENLRTTRYSNGTDIALGNSTSTTTAYRYYPDNDQSYVSTYGYLYNWPAVMGNSSSSSANPSGVQGICPTGWHVPSDAEWTQLEHYLSSQSQYVCGSSTDNIAKALASATGWNSSTNICAVGNNPSANNATGFSALPAGSYDGDSNYFGDNANFWSATESNDGNAYYRNLDYYFALVFRSYLYKGGGYSVRCVRDVYGAISVVTQSVSNLTANSVTCGGEVLADGGVPVTACGFCWSTSENPTLNDNHTVDNSGSAVFTSVITDLSAATTYYVRAYATNSEGMAYGDELSFTTLPSGDALPCPGAATVTDIDNNTYNTVQIGTQCWMKENLRTTRYSNGTSIPLGSIYSYTDPYCYYPNNDQSNVSTYGYLYNWRAVMDSSSSSSANPSGVQGICPNGWHVPSDAEWTQLENYLSSQSQYVCGNNNTYIAKALASSMGWDSSTGVCAVGNNPSANNATGLSALPAGYFYGGYYYFGYNADFWSATENNDSYACYRTLNHNSASVLRGNYSKNNGFSVRCVRD